MLAVERQSRIAELINQHQSVTVSELCETFAVSDMTIRRDLLRLEKRGILSRTHGGAIILKPAPADHPYYSRVHEQIQEKQAIARLAAAMVQDGETIALDAGTTIANLARQLTRKRDLTIITNSIHVINEMLGTPHVTVISTGGSLWEPTVSLVGPIAVSTLRRFHVDKAFLATPAISLEAGVTNSNLYEAEVKSTMIEIARERILLVDHTKFGRTSYAIVAPLSAYNRLITDDGTPAAFIEGIRARGLEVLVADRRETNTPGL